MIVHYHDCHNNYGKDDYVGHGYKTSCYGFDNYK